MKENLRPNSVTELGILNLGFRYIPSNGIAGSHGSSIFNFSGKLQTVLHWRSCGFSSRPPQQSSITVESHEFFGFLVHIKVMFTLYYSLLNVQ